MWVLQYHSSSFQLALNRGILHTFGNIYFRIHLSSQLEVRPRILLYLKCMYSAPERDVSGL